MTVLVAAAIVRVEKTCVRRKIRDGEGALFSRIGQLRWRAASYRNGVDIKNTGLVTVKQQRLFVCGEGTATDANRVHELFDGVFLDGRRLLLRLRNSAGSSDDQR